MAESDTSMTTMHVRSLLALVLAGSMLTSVAHADEPAGASSDAEQHFARARQLYDEGDFALSLVEMRRAYELSPNYRVLYNIAQVNIQLFDYAAARVALEKYLQDGAAEIPAGRRAQAEADMKMLRDRTAYLQIVSVPQGDVSIDERPAGKAPFEEPLLVNAGQRKVVVTRPGYQAASRTVTLAGGDRTDLRFDLTLVPEEKPRQIIVVPKTTSEKNYTPAVIGWITTGALTVGAAVVGGLYLSQESEIERLSNKELNVSQQTKADAEATATRLSVTADILGLAAVGAGLVSLYFTVRPPHSETTVTGKLGLRVAPTVTGLRGTF